MDTRSHGCGGEMRRQDGVAKDDTAAAVTPSGHATAKLNAARGTAQDDTPAQVFG